MVADAASWVVRWGTEDEEAEVVAVVAV